MYESVENARSSVDVTSFLVLVFTQVDPLSKSPSKPSERTEPSSSHKAFLCYTHLYTERSTIQRNLLRQLPRDDSSSSARRIPDLQEASIHPTRASNRPQQVVSTELGDTHDGIDPAFEHIFNSGSSGRRVYRRVHMGRRCLLGTGHRFLATASLRTASKLYSAPLFVFMAFRQPHFGAAEWTAIHVDLLGPN